MTTFSKWQKSDGVKAVWKSNTLCELELKHRAFLRGDAGIESLGEPERGYTLWGGKEQRSRVNEDLICTLDTARC